MAAFARTRVLRPVEPQMEPEPLDVEAPETASEDQKSIKDGVLRIEHPDGSVTIDTNPTPEPSASATKGFYANLAPELAKDGKLQSIATELLDGIRIDEDSRREWLATRAKGITLLGLNIEDPRGDTSSGSAPLEGQSSIRHPLLLEATVRFQATARGELLPATGPVKVRNDSTPSPPKPPAPPPVAPPPMMPPPGMPPGGSAMPSGAPFSMGGPGPLPPPGGPPMGGAPPSAGLPGPMSSMPQAPSGRPTPPPAMGHNGGPALDWPNQQDELANALEKDMNHYLTVTAPEYVPDTDRMLFYVGFGGDGFKKVFHCPLRERPVSESVDAEDLIVSNAATDLQNCGRVTHKIKMRKSVMRRMQILGEYLDIKLPEPTQAAPNAVEQKKEEIAGQNQKMQRPEDADYTIYECYCELDIDQFAPKHLKGKGLPLPYRVTIERDSQQILSVVRNWKEKDKQCLAKQFFVQFPFIRGLGFYGLGFIHLVGNITATLTAAYREMLDAGMFANFPGFLFNNLAGRQLTNMFRIPPGGGQALDIGAMDDIRKAVMPLPYKEPGPSFTSFIQHVEEIGSRLAMTAEVNIGEGKQDAPVGTTLALIEQATKVIDSAHKRLHAAQSQEFILLKERFQEDPEAFWKFNKKPTKPWKKEEFLKAINDYELVPVADPNNPTSLHRAAKATAIKELQKASAQLYNAQAVDRRIMRILGIDPEGLFNETPLPPPPDPRFEAIKQKAQTSAQQIQAQQQDSLRRLQMQIAQLEDKAADRVSREKLEQMKIALEGVKLQEERLIHAHELVGDQVRAHSEMQADQARTSQELQFDHVRNASEIAMDQQQRQHDLGMSQVERANDLHTERQTHAQRMSHQQQMHEQRMEHDRQLQEQKLAHAKALAALKPKVAE